MPVISMDNVSKSYEDISALSDITLDIGRGEIFGILGPNGAGKTTTIEILTGQLQPDSGDVSVLGIDPVESPVEARNQMGILPERESPPSFFTPREYFEFVSDLRGMENDTIAEHITNWAEELSFSDQLDTLHTDLSRGQQQKVMITQAFFHQPSVVIIDEPLVNLDPIMQERVKELFMDYVTSDRTILLSTHDIDVAEEVCTSVGFVTDGEIATKESITDDGHSDLLSAFVDATDKGAGRDGIAGDD